ATPEAMLPPDEPPMLPPFAYSLAARRLMVATQIGPQFDLREGGLAAHDSLVAERLGPTLGVAIDAAVNSLAPA
ncbi:MAG TPA: hypothetical protein VE591_03545, partial [Candidatus Acidoferrum sp.]|nr:hypothetical protein [Candidatus Acidoferrum sp.]